MGGNSREREVRFAVRNDALVRTVIFPNGRPGYEQRCSEETYEAVAHEVDASPAQGEGVTLVAATGAPFTQVAIALEFMKDRGVLETRHQRNYRSSDTACEDAMVEYHALAEKGRMQG